MSATELLGLARGLRPLIEAEAEATEEARTMTKPVVDALVESGLFRLIMPSAFGGHEADVATILEVCEEIAQADGSVGWAFAQNTTCMGYLAYVDPEVARSLASARAGAGMFAPNGVAQTEDGGYRVSGSYQFGSGCGHADFMGGAAMVMQDGEMAPFRDGLPMLRGFLVPADKVEIKDNWHVMGLSGTGSFDYEVPEQHVDEGATFWLFETKPVTGGPLYGVGPVPLGTISSVAWAIGVAERALAEIVEIVTTGARARMGQAPLREQPIFQRDLAKHEMALASGRLLARNVYERMIEAIDRGDEKTVLDAHLRETRAAATWIVQACKAAVVFAYEASGSQGMRSPNRLQRCFRDIHVGAAHLVFDERNFTEHVKTRLGLEPLPF